MTSRIMCVREAIEKALHDDKQIWTKYFVMAEQKTGVKRIQIFIGLVAFVAIYLVFGYGSQLVCNFIGFAYPAYCSMKALETRQKEDDTKWLTYWVVFATFSLAEYFSNFIVSWVPVYWLLKTLILVWCMAPIENNGSTVLHKCLINPYVSQTSKPSKCVFLIWCFLPIQNNGSVFLYNKYIRPRFLQHQGQVDDLLNNITNQAAKIATKLE